jgi:diketogulonate reductase-like aldo/keto reductase
MPAIGLGTFGSDKYGPAEVAAAVREAASVGYRHFDCASVYRNEPEVGEALQGVAADGISRESLWITSKVWNDRHHEVEQSCEQSLADLKLDYVDLYLVHWPFPNSHGPGVSVDSRDPHAVPFVHEQFMETWRKMERLVDRGLVRHIGTSNMTVSKLTGVLRDASMPPAANEMEIHPHFQQPELFDFCVQNQILPIGYCPIGSPSRPERDRTPEDTVDTEDPVITAAASRLGVHPAVVCVLWQIQRGSVPIPFSVKRSQFESMLRAVETMRLTDEEMAQISGIDRHCRLIKGQVFLWESARGWEDLWE